MRLTLNDFSKGLWLVGGKDNTMKGYMRRLRGAHELRTPTLRSRAGSTQLFTTNAVTTITKFDGSIYKFVSSTGILYRDGVSVATGLTTSPNVFVKIPPQPGIEDWLFVTAGSSPKKISSANVVRNWGIAIPGTGMAAADNGAGALAAGVYQYLIVNKNSVTGSRSNPNTTPASVTLGAGRQIQLTNIPTSADAQVDQREVYRTTAGGARYFRVVLLDNTATTYNDNNLDVNLSSIELQFDNAAPLSFVFTDAWKSLDQRMWWLNTQFGTGGRAYYSPPGRPESVRGFIEVSATDEFLTKGVMWSGTNWVFGINGLYRILGDEEPFIAVPVDGVPGTSQPRAVTVTPYGIAYLSYDGVYLFDGTRASLLGFDEIAPIFRSEPVENLDQIDMTAHMTYARDQLYLTSPLILTNSGQTLVLNMRTRTWRDLGLNLATLYKEPDSARLLASFADNVYALEDPGTVEDGITDIPLEWEFGGALTDLAHFGTIQRVFLDIMTTSETLTVTLITDGVSTALGTVTTAARTTIEFPIGKLARVFSLRLSGNVDNKIELFGVGMDVKLEGAQDEVGIG